MTTNRKSKEPSKAEKSETKAPATETSKKIPKQAVRYFVVGLATTLISYVIYSILANVIINNNELLWLSSLISTSISAVAGYFMHSRITWSDRKVDKTAIYKFIIWNFIIAFVIVPCLTQLFSLITPLYDLAFGICQFIHIPFSYEFVLTTGAFVLTCIVVMVINFLFYDRFVFGSKASESC